MSNINNSKYRFITGSLFVITDNKEYVHCYTNAFDNTKAKAIKAYEAYDLEINQDLNGNWS